MDLQVPSVNVYQTPTIASILSAWLTQLLGGTIWLKLYQNNVAVGPTTGLAGLVEADFGGYVKTVVASFSAVNIDGAGQAYALTPLSLFQCNGTSGNTIYGAFLSASNGTTATATNAGATGNYSGTFVITAAGSGYTVAPNVHLTGATGANATAHAVITAGAVTAIVLDNPGNGAYTTYTVVIDAPEIALIIAPFPNPVNVALATDAVPYVQQMAIPPISI